MESDRSDNEFKLSFSLHHDTLQITLSKVEVDSDISITLHIKSTQTKEDMNFFKKLLIVLLTSFPMLGYADTITTKIGTVNVPDGLQILDRDEKPDSKTGKPSGLIVFSKANDVPRAVFIITWSYVEPDGKAYDPLDVAVKIGNPFDKKLTSQDARSVKVGGVDGGRYEGILPNGLKAISYVVANGPYRFIVLLKAPATSPYKELTNDFAKAIEQFAWALPEVNTGAEAK